MTARSKPRRKKKKGTSARHRRVKEVKKLSRKTRVRPTRVHNGDRRRRRRKPRTKDLSEEEA